MNLHHSLIAITTDGGCSTVDAQKGFVFSIFNGNKMFALYIGIPDNFVGTFLMYHHYLNQQIESD